MEKTPKKKKMSLTQFFSIYILILAAILFGIVACNSTFSSGDTKKEPQSTSVSENNGNNESTGKGEETGSKPTSEPVTDSKLPLSGLTIVVDAGHQENPPEGKESYMPWDQSKTKAKNTHGTTGISTGNNEYEINLEIALKVRDTLQSQGAKVVMTRENHGTSLSNQDRANIANTSNAQVALSIHCNGSDNSSVAGVEIYSRGSGDGTAEYASRSTSDQAIAQGIINAVCKSTGAKNRGSKTSDNYTGINYSKIPFIILECGFMSNPEEDKNLADPAYQQKIADGICDYFKENKSTLLG